MKQLVVVFAFLLSIFSLQAQEKKEVEITQDITEGPKPGTKKIRIVKNINGKTEVTERIISDKDSNIEMELLDEEDTLIKGKKKNIKVIVKDDNEFIWKEEGDNNNIRNSERQFRQNMPSGRRNGSFDEVYFRMTDGTHQTKKMLIEDSGNGNYNKATIRGLNVYTNMPQTETINISFYAENEGDVMISVVDLKGNIVAKENVKSFKGDYVGQLGLKKNSKGTFFVIVSQGDDGQTRKVNVK